jgi:DNA (cytosine-5)-methyltransferase 1
LSVCSGIEATSVAWGPLGFAPVAFAEIEPFPSAVLAHHYPTVPNWGDLTKFKEWPDATFDLLVGGTPCQSFSVAGLRAGLADPRGNLALVYLALADRYRPRWLVWENVPGVLSSGGGRDFGAFLGGLAALGYGFSYRVLDAQYFGLAQRRQRVFVVGHLGDWRRAAAVLFERESLSGHPAPRQQEGQGVAGSLGAGSARSGGRVGRREAAANHLVAPPISLCLNAGGMGRIDAESETLIPTGGSFDVAHSLRADGFDASEDGTGRGTPIVPMLAPCLTQNYGKQPDNSDTSAGPMLVATAFDARQSDVIQYGEKTGPLDTDGYTMAVAFHENQRAEVTTNDTAGAINSGGGKPGQGYPAVQSGMQVRRLTPRECERLQGFPDDYTLIPYRGKLAADGPRYKALGNSMAVSVMHWLGSRIWMVEQSCPT